MSEHTLWAVRTADGRHTAAHDRDEADAVAADLHGIGHTATVVPWPGTLERHAADLAAGDELARFLGVAFTAGYERETARGDGGGR